MSELVPISSCNYTDPILDIVKNDSITTREVELISSSSHFSPREQDECLAAANILTALENYLKETNGWRFCTLNNYDFNVAAESRSFGKDVASVVANRSQEILDDTKSWNIEQLKTSVMKLEYHFTDSSALLTGLILRIITRYNELQSILELAMIRASLIKMNHELSAIFDKIDSKTKQEGQKASPIVTAYRSFVSSLLREMENSPYEEVQQEMVQIVKDLERMFHVFNTSQSSDANKIEGPPSRKEPQYGEYFEGDRDSSVDSEEPLHPPSSTAYKRGGSVSSAWGPQGMHSFGLRKQWSRSSISSDVSSTTNKSITSELPSLMAAFDEARLEESFDTDVTSAVSSPNSTSTILDKSVGSMLSRFANYGVGLSTPAVSPMPLQKAAKPPLNLSSHHSSNASQSLKNYTVNLPNGSSEKIAVKLLNNKLMVSNPMNPNEMIDMQDYLNRITSPKPEPSIKLSSSLPSLSISRQKQLTFGPIHEEDENIPPVIVNSGGLLGQLAIKNYNLGGTNMNNTKGILPSGPSPFNSSLLNNFRRN